MCKTTRMIGHMSAISLFPYDNRLPFPISVAYPSPVFALSLSHTQKKKKRKNNSKDERAQRSALPTSPLTKQ